MGKSKKSFYVNTIIKNKIFPFDLMVSFNQSDKDFIKSFNDYDLDFENDVILTLEQTKTNQGRTILFPTGPLVMRLNYFPKSPEEFGMLAHEIFHVVEFILQRVNVKLSRKSDECFAYMIGFYTKEIFELINKNKK